MNWFKRSISYLFSLALIAFLLLSAVDYCCFDQKFYLEQYQKLNTAETIGVSAETLDQMTSVLLDYLRDEEKTLELVAKVQGSEREVFNEREIKHMVDVRALYQNAMMVRDLCGLLLVVSLVISLLLSDEKMLFWAFKRIFILFMAGFLALLLVAIVDFDFFWTNFHYIFFAGNDLWLLDPRTDILIMMVPLEFFNALVMRIVGFFFASLAAAALLLFCIKKVNND